jgi:hypothetical protein
MNSIEEGIAGLTKAIQEKKKELEFLENKLAEYKEKKETMIRQARGVNRAPPSDSFGRHGQSSFHDSIDQSRSIKDLEVEAGREQQPSSQKMDLEAIGLGKSLRDAKPAEPWSREMGADRREATKETTAAPLPSLKDRQQHDQSYYKLMDAVQFSHDIFKVIEREDDKDSYLLLSKSADEKVSHLSEWNSRDNRLEEIEALDMNIIDVCCTTRADGRTAIYVAVDDLSIYQIFLSTARGHQTEFFTIEKQAVVHSFILQPTLNEGRVFFEDERKTVVGYFCRAGENTYYCSVDRYNRAPKKLQLEFPRLSPQTYIQQALLLPFVGSSHRLMILTPDSVLEMAQSATVSRQQRADKTAFGINTCFAQLSDQRLLVASTRCIDMEKNNSGRINGSYTLSVFNQLMRVVDSVDVSTDNPFFEFVLQLKARSSIPGIDIIVAVSAVYSTFLMTKVTAHIDIFLLENDKLCRTSCFDSKKIRATQSAVNSFLLEKKKLTLAGSRGLLKVMMLC